MNQDQVLQRLKEGNERFIQNQLEGKLQDGDRRLELTGGKAQ